MGKRSRHSIGTRAFDLLLETIRSAREGAGLSQREVARRLGFHPTVYGKMERGDRVLDVVEFVELARSIGVDPIELLGTFLVTVQQDRISQDLKTRD